MSEIKYEIIQKIGVLSSPLRPSLYEDLRRTLTAPLRFGYDVPQIKTRFGGSQALRVFCKMGFVACVQSLT
jgi:hypothetical protein